MSYKLRNIVKSPVKGYNALTVTSDFGYRSFTYNGKKYSGNHNGIDLVPVGNIVAVARGKVTACRNTIQGYTESNASGNYVTLYHGSGVYTTYCHLDYGSVKVKTGDIVEAGTILGTNCIKTTGFSTGLHLHYGIQVNGTWVDPKPYLLGTKNIPSYNTSTNPTNTKSVDELAQEVIKGLWGNGNDRKQRLTAAGYNYSTIQSRVNEILSGKTTSNNTIYYTVKIQRLQVFIC